MTRTYLFRGLAEVQTDGTLQTLGHVLALHSPSLLPVQVLLEVVQLQGQALDLLVFDTGRVGRSPPSVWLFWNLCYDEWTLSYAIARMWVKLPGLRLSG